MVSRGGFLVRFGVTVTAAVGVGDAVSVMVGVGEGVGVCVGVGVSVGVGVIVGVGVGLNTSMYKRCSYRISSPARLRGPRMTTRRV
jgi:hypothetical protein